MRALIVSVFVAVLPFAATSLAAEREAVFVAQAKDAQIDMNWAKADELMTLKGIGEARAAAIINGRPYARKDELVQKKILPETVYNEIKDRIIAKQ
jgi:DNA uptake protein ComE-like DNA-binding protein